MLKFIIAAIVDHRLGETEKALTGYNKAIEINPDNAEYWYCKSKCLGDLYKE